MDDTWRLTAKSVTKYDPTHRDENGFYTKSEWVSFHQVGQFFDNKLLTFEAYSEVEKKYIEASICFFKFHKTKKIHLKNIEKNDFANYNQKDRESLVLFYHSVTDGFQITVDELNIIVKLILRNLIWAELFDNNSEEIALRFGYDYYMYFNSNENMDELFKSVAKIGLYVH